MGDGTKEQSRNALLLTQVRGLTVTERCYNRFRRLPDRNRVNEKKWHFYCDS